VSSSPAPEALSQGWSTPTRANGCRS
jgi:hypothetical protein